MSKYVLAFRGQPDRDPAPGEDAAWGAWFGGLGGAIVDFGNRVGHVERLDAEHGGDAAKETLTGYVVVEAADIDAAMNLARGCPGLASGVSVEVAETVPMSG
jgi:transcription antitermination factor NusG